MPVSFETKALSTLFRIALHVDVNTVTHAIFMNRRERPLSFTSFFFQGLQGM